ncbi:tail fiber protein [Salmonella phage SeF3a]|nr:tail fiber protein [Salmonella phage SeF3a]
MGYFQMTRNVEELFGGVVTAPHQIPFTYKSSVGGETFFSLPFYPVTGVITINGGMQVPLDNFEIDGNTLNLGRALSKGDVVYCLFDKILSPEDTAKGIRIYKFQAVGGETEFTPDFTSYGVQSLYIGGEYKTPDIEYSYNSTTGKVSLQTALTAGVWVVAEMSVKQPNISPAFDRSIQEIARSANVKDSEVIVSTDTISLLDGKKVVYDIAAQTSYGLPTIPDGSVISSVSGGKLTYNPGDVQVDLLPLPDSAQAVKLFYLQPSGAENIKVSSGDTVQDILNNINKHRVVSSISELLNVSPTETTFVFVASFHPSTNYGGGFFRWDPSGNKAAHNGGTIIDPGKTFPTWDSAGKTSWFTASGTGTGVWRRQDVMGHYRAEDFGALPWNVGDAHDSTKEFQQVANVAYRGGCWRWTGRHRITSYIDIPNKQTFGSYAQMTSVYSELFQPSNFQGVHVISDPSLARSVQNAVFYDAATGEAFRCGEGASPTDCLVYGRGFTTTGMDVATSLPPASSYCDTQAFRHSKAINVRNVTVALMKYALDSNPWDASKGDYYSTTDHMVILYCYCISRVPTGQDITFNTKHINMRAYVNQIGDYGLAVRNVVFIGGSIEGYNTSTFIRSSTQLSFKGTYFETGDTSFNGIVFSLIGWCTLNFEECLVYLNNTTNFVSSGGSGQSAGVLGLTIKSQGNVWRKTDVGTTTVFAVDPVTNKQALVGSEILNAVSGATIAYWAGAVPPGTYTAPISVAF